MGGTDRPVLRSCSSSTSHCRARSRLPSYERRQLNPPDEYLLARARATFKATIEGSGVVQIRWENDLDAARRRAAAENKPVLLDFSAAPH